MNLVFADLLLEHVLLLDNASDLLVAHAFDLSFNIFAEVQVSKNFGLSRLFGYKVGSLLGSGLLLSEQVLLGLHGHTELAELEEHLEVRDEGSNFIHLRGVRDFFEDRTLNTFGGHVDLSGEVVDILLFESRWIATLDGGGERLRAGENINSLH